MDFYSRSGIILALITLLGACQPVEEATESINSHSQSSETATYESTAEHQSDKDALESGMWKNYTFSYNQTNPDLVLEELFSGKDTGDLLIPTVFSTSPMYRHYSGYFQSSHESRYQMKIYESMEPMPENPEGLMKGDTAEGYIGAAIPETYLNAVSYNMEETARSMVTYNDAQTNWLQDDRGMEATEHDLGYGITGYRLKREGGLDSYSWNMGDWLVTYENYFDFNLYEDYDSLDVVRDFVVELQEYPLPEIEGKGVLTVDTDMASRHLIDVSWNHGKGYYSMHVINLKSPMEVVMTIAGMRQPG